MGGRVAVLKTQSNLPPPPLAIDVAPAGESCHLADSGSGRWRSPHNGCSRLSLAHATPFGQAASSEAGTCISAMQRRLGIWKWCQNEQAGRVLASLLSSSRVPPIARNHVVVVGWNFAGVSSPTQPLAFLQATRSQPGPQIGGLPANDKGPFCHFCRAGDGWSLEFPFHGIA